MLQLKRTWAKFCNLFRRNRAEDELVREIAAHLAMLEVEYLRQGMTLGDARLAARRAYGGVEQAKELHRDERSFVWLEQVMQDLRHAVRSLWKSPGFSSVALLSLAFGIGANTAIFTLVNGILLKRLPVSEPHRIVQVIARMPDFRGTAFSFPAFRALRNLNDVFDSAVAVFATRSNLILESGPQKVDIQIASGSYFSFFNATPELGRLLTDGDDRVEGANPVCVLSHHTWQTQFAGDPQIIGRTIHLDDVALQVVGVVRGGFVGADLLHSYDIWAPTALSFPLTRIHRESPNNVWLGVLARLRPGVSFTEASARLQAASKGIEDSLPKGRANVGAVYTIVDASKGFGSWRTRLRDPLMVLLGTVVIVLLVACANLANLLLARTSERSQEFAIKLALGISRWRLLRQVLVETFVLTIAGGVLATMVSLWLTQFLLRLFNTGNRFDTLHVSPDMTVLLFTSGACILTALIAGLYPAWQASRSTAGPGLKGAGLFGSSRSLVRRALILVQVALAVVLLFGASLFTRSLRNLKTVDLGFEIDHVLNVVVSPRAIAKPARTSAMAGLLARIRQLPSVESAAYASPGILSGAFMTGTVEIADASNGTKEVEQVYHLFTGPSYLATLRTPLLRGRDFAPGDRPGSPPVVIVNQRFAKMAFGDADPLGRHVNTWGKKSVEIIGVAGNSKFQNVREENMPIVYMPFDQEEGLDGTLIARCRNLPAAEQEIRSSLRSDGTTFKLHDITAMELRRDSLIAQDRLLAFLSSLFGGLGTALALVGIYGLISYAVARRTREIGIRMSAGAQRSDVLWLFLREAAVLAGVGMLIGTPLALGLARFLGTLLYQESISDPVAVSVSLGLLLLGGLSAALLPARRATRVDPVQALRYD
jgi:predicted permease